MREDIEAGIVALLEKKGIVPTDPALRSAFRFIDAGLVDSVALIKFVIELEDRFNIELAPEDPQTEAFRTIGGLAGLVAQRQTGAEAGAGVSPTLMTLIRARAAARPTHPALVAEDGTLTYADLIARVDTAAARLAGLGVGRTSRLAMLLPNGSPFVVLMLAAADLGATIVPLAVSLPPAGLSAALAAGDCTHLIGWHAVLGDHAAAVGAAGAVPPDRWVSVGGSTGPFARFDDLPAVAGYRPDPTVTPDSDFILTMTSGSTGAPKPIVFTQQTKINRALAARDLYALGEEDRILAATPLYHSLAQRLVLLPLMLGATAVVMSGFSAVKWLDWVERERITATIAVSSQLESILAARAGSAARLDSLRVIVSSSALLRDSVKKRLIDALACDFHECYGASEVGIVSNLDPAAARSHTASVGVAAPGVEIRITDPDGAPVPPGTVGEITVRTPNAFSRYFNNEPATRAAHRDGFFRTGDLGRLESDGFLYFAGREKEIIIVGGINVYPKDVEDVIGAHPDVHECAVVGIDDCRLGEAVLAVVAVRPGAQLTERDLRRHCMTRLADFQQPSAIVFIAELPRNAMGKVHKPTLVERFGRPGALHDA